MTDGRFDDPLGAALRAELHATFVPFDATRADEMIAAATCAGPAAARRNYAPLAAAAAVVLIGGGVAAFAGMRGSDGPAPAGGPAGGPAPASTASPSGCGIDPGYCGWTAYCPEVGAQGASPMPSELPVTSCPPPRPVTSPTTSYSPHH